MQLRTRLILTGGVCCPGLSVTGVAKQGELLLKLGAKPGDALVLTKALGTGVIMAASMRGRALGRWISGTCHVHELAS